MLCSGTEQEEEGEGEVFSPDGQVGRRTEKTARSQSPCDAPTKQGEGWVVLPKYVSLSVKVLVYFLNMLFLLLNVTVVALWVHLP